MHVLIAPDKFKGTLDAYEVAAAIAAGVEAAGKGHTYTICPLADGGEGTAEILTRASGGTMQSFSASDPLFRHVKCRFGISGDGQTAFIDLAEASGLQRLSEDERNATRATTLGTGELIALAVRKRCRRIVLGLGGSATMDGGFGIVHALGYRFRNEEGDVLVPRASNLQLIKKLDARSVQWPAKRMDLILAYDVTNPLLGDEGAIMFAGQKGLDEEAAKEAMKGLHYFADFLERHTSRKLTTLPGMGAAGGAGIACKALLGAKLMPGIEAVLTASGFEAALQRADLVITGEGRLDAQTLKGKAISGIARRAAAADIPCVAIAGTVTLKRDKIEALGLGKAVPLYRGKVDMETARRDSAQKITQAIPKLLKGS